jgi:HD-like signal output (HDOD) protein
MNPLAADLADRIRHFRLENLSQLSPLVARMLILNTIDDQAENEFLLILESEPALTARLIILANSVLLGARGQPTMTVRQALRRLGLDSAKLIAIGFLCIRPLQTRLAPALRQALWLHSLAIGLAARVIANQVHFREPESAFLAGLLHDIGFMVLEIQQPGAAAGDGNGRQVPSKLRTSRKKPVRGRPHQPDSQSVTQLAISTVTGNVARLPSSESTSVGCTSGDPA